MSELNKNIILNVIPKLKATEGLLGVEIEVEGRRLPQDLRPYWRTDMDGSLKGAESFEYVMPKPSSLGGVKEALDFLQHSYKAARSTVDESVRAGVHVHLNVQQLTLKQFFTLTTAYFIVDELVTTFCGPSREGNHFCLRGKDAEFILFKLVEAAKTRNLRNLNDNNLRYCSYNIVSLFKYGSVEFRAMRGTGDLDAIYEWCEIVSAINDGAKKWDNPRDVLVSMSEGGEEAFLFQLLGDKVKHFENHPELKRMIRQGARRVQMLAFGVDWNTYKDVKINPFL